MKFLYHDNNGIERASVVLSHDAGANYYIQQFFKVEDLASVPASAWISLIQQAMSEAKKLAAARVEFRLIDVPSVVDVADNLPALGFTRLFDRVEFRAPLADLPSDETESPLRWVSLASDKTWTLEAAADLFQAVSAGDSECDPAEDKAELLRCYLSDSVLTGGLDCVHVGYLAQRPVALVVAQINTRSGWSRISYMGLIPKVRGQHLGRWVHRHGFSMMRAQGGVLYHGGTLAQNARMIRLFLAHGCNEYRRFQVWFWGR